MNLFSFRKISIFVTTLVILGVFAFPATTKASFMDDLLGSFGMGNGGQSGSYGNNGYDTTASQHQGDIEISKGARRVNRDQDFHENITVRSGELVEVLIEIKNTSSKHIANTTIQDELGGSFVYVKNSLRINGQATQQTGLTSGGLRMTIPTKSKVIVSYRMNICSGSTYPIRASAYSAGVGSATDGIIIRMEDEYLNSYSNNTSHCLAQFYTLSTTIVTNPTSNPTTTINPTYNTGNIFGDWASVSGSGATANTTPNNPFAGWTGVNNADSNAYVASNNANITHDIFGDWATVAGSGTNTGSSSGGIGEWTGSSNSIDTTGVFGDWASLAGSGNTQTLATNDSGYDMSGYSTARYAVPTDYSANRPIAYTASAYQAPTNYVAPTTGVNRWAGFAFAGLLTVGYLLFRKRQFFFN